MSRSRSNAQQEASRRNGALSHGPRTPEGKAASSRNALRHGLLGREVVLADEDPEEFAAHAAGLASDLTAEGTLAAVLVERLAATTWRLRRCARAEASLFEAHRDGTPPGRGSLGIAVMRDATVGQGLDRIGRHEAALERSMFRLIREVQRLQSVMPRRLDSVRAVGDAGGEPANPVLPDDDSDEDCGASP